MNIVVTYDSSVMSLKNTDLALYTNFTSAVGIAVAYYDKTFTNTVTTHIKVGWGEVEGNSITASNGPLGASSSSYDTFTYAQLYATVQASDTISAVQKTAAALLSPTDPSDDADFRVTTADAVVLGLTPATPANDGSFGLNSGRSYGWTGANVPAGSYTRATVARYFHIELAEHDLLLAEGLAAESWLDTGNRAMFANADVTALRADLGPGERAAEPCVPVLTDGPVLAGIRARLDRIGVEIGRPAWRSVRLELERVGACAVMLPAGVGWVRLACAEGVRAPDRRHLGALIAGIAVDGGAIPLDGAGLVGFHEIEDHGGGPVRWTGRDAALEIAPMDRDRVVCFSVASLAVMARRGQDGRALAA